MAEQDWNIDVLQIQKFTSPFYGTMDNWGVLDKQKVIEYLDWLLENNLVEGALTVEELVVYRMV